MSATRSALTHTVSEKDLRSYTNAVVAATDSSVYVEATNYDIYTAAVATAYVTEVAADTASSDFSYDFER